MVFTFNYGSSAFGGGGWGGKKTCTVWFFILFYFFFNIYVHDSVHRNSRLKKSNKMQQHADIYLLLNYSTCFRRPSHPSSGVHKTVVAASGTDHAIWGASFLKRDQKSPQIV